MPLPGAWLLLLLLGLTRESAARSVPVYDARGLFTDRLTPDDRARLRSCPCSERPRNSSVNNSDEQLSSFASLCLPVDFAGKRSRKEVFAFSVATDDRWKHYDWDQLTTVAWNEDKELLCHAHSKGVKVVIKHNFDDVDQLCNATARRDWIKATYTQIVENYADGVNIDTEKPMHGATAQCLASLVYELRHDLEQHALTKNAQITFDVPWAPRGVDGRYYPWRQLADAADFLFVMSYDMRSQVYDACVAGANAPRALVQQGLQEFLLGFDIAPDKLVLGVPWYGYDYPCLEQQGAIDDASRCRIRSVPFFGAPCSDAAGGQIDYADVRRLVKGHGLVEQWDPTTETPFVWYAKEGSPSRRSQIWFDNPRSLRAKYRLVRDLGLRGVGMWNADTLDYSGGVGADNDTRLMWSSLAEAFAS